MSGRSLDASYAAFKIQIGAHAYARQAATRSTATPDLLGQLGLSTLIGEVARDRRTRILEHFEQVGRQIRRQSFIDLVSSFEYDLFKLLGMATSKARHVLNGHYDPSYPGFKFRSDLARTPADYANLNGYKRLLMRPAASGSDPRRDLWEVIAYRDFLAHGERWEPPAVPPTIEAAYQIMADELDGISARI